MSADVLSKWGLLININLLLERGIFAGEFGDFLSRLKAEPMVRRAEQRHEI